MLFNSLSYFLFLPVVFLLHYLSPDKLRWMVLLGASFFFYAALRAPHLIVVLLLITAITYFIGILIDRKESLRSKQYLLWYGIFANVLTLLTLKFLPFIIQNLNFVLNRIPPFTTVPVGKTIIAIGTSYYIFQAISYLVDIYLEIEKPERHFGHFMLYMSFFPKVLQGPIERCNDLLPQFKVPYVFNYDNVRSGMLLFALGLLKKVVIADRLAMMVNPVFDNAHAYKGFTLLIATYYYSLQIYFDFSGYTDMALGTALMFNINLTQNFNNPYFATSIADFWRRWHISFSRWILDYIFKPLQMSWRYLGDWGTALALLITFTVSGAWHGASWGFIVWGALHGIYMASSVISKKLKTKILHVLHVKESSIALKLLEMVFVFNLVSIAWIFFRAPSINDALYILYNYFAGMEYTISNLSLEGIASGIISLSPDKSLLEVLILLIYIIIVTAISNMDYFKLIQNKCNCFLRWSYYTFIISSIMLLGYFGENDFVYFKF